VPTEKNTRAGSVHLYRYTDGEVDLTDLATLLARFGATCP
jgi:hypothetical protein